MIWRVREVQLVEHVWEVEAESQEEAERSAESGVPDGAAERMLWYEVDARKADSDGK